MKDKKMRETRKPKAAKQVAAKIPRELKGKLKELKTQEAKLILDYLHYWTDPVSIEMADFLWRFLVYLHQKKIRLIDEKTIFCFPFAKMVKLKNLK